MAQSKPDTTAVTDMMNQVQALITTNPMMGTQMMNVLKAQQRLLDEVQEYSKHWIARRQESTESAMAATKDLSGKDAQNPAEAMSVMLEWQKHSMERMTEDFQEWMDMCSRCIGPVSDDDAKPKS